MYLMVATSLVASRPWAWNCSKAQLCLLHCRHLNLQGPSILLQDGQRAVVLASVALLSPQGAPHRVLASSDLNGGPVCLGKAAHPSLSGLEWGPSLAFLQKMSNTSCLWPRYSLPEHSFIHTHLSAHSFIHPLSPHSFTQLGTHSLIQLGTHSFIFMEGG